MIANADVERYREKGYICVPSLLPPKELAEIVNTANEVMAGARELDRSDDVLDLDDTHTRAQPLVRRIKNPNQHHEVFQRLTANQRILD
ncbi:MAG: hypothetical protein JNM30_13885, partial [Rhodospirillales bacterium]|nr:hypothetical protein [Rhodospirillales bacterium]